MQLEKWTKTIDPVTGKRTALAPRPNNVNDAIGNMKDAMDFCIAEFKAKHGNTKTPSITVEMKGRHMVLRAKNY